MRRCCSMTLSLPSKLVYVYANSIRSIDTSHIRTYSFIIVLFHSSTHQPLNSITYKLSFPCHMCGGKSTTLSWLTVADQNIQNIWQRRDVWKLLYNSSSYTNYPHGEMVRLMRALPFAYISLPPHRRKIRKSDALRFPCSMYVYRLRTGGWCLGGWTKQSSTYMCVLVNFVYSKSDHIYTRIRKSWTYITYIHSPFMCYNACGTAACESRLFVCQSM